MECEPRGSNNNITSVQVEDQKERISHATRLVHFIFHSGFGKRAVAVLAIVSLLFLTAANTSELVLISRNDTSPSYLDCIRYVIDSAVVSDNGSESGIASLRKEYDYNYDFNLSSCTNYRRMYLYNMLARYRMIVCKYDNESIVIDIREFVPVKYQNNGVVHEKEVVLSNGITVHQDEWEAFVNQIDYINVEGIIKSGLT